MQQETKEYPRGPLSSYATAKWLEADPEFTVLEAIGGGTGKGGRGRGGGLRFKMGGPSQRLDMSRKDYGLQTIWDPSRTIAESNQWAEDQINNPYLTQFERNTYSDPMAKRQGLGRYYMNPGESHAPSAGHTVVTTPTRDYSNHISSGAYGL